MASPPDTSSLHRAAFGADADDYAVMQAVAARDQNALAALYDRHSPLLFALAQRILHDRASAEDLLIDVFWELWNRSDRYDPGRGSPLTYMLTLARSRAIDRRRSALKRRTVQTDTDTTGANRTPASEIAPDPVTPLTDAMARELAGQVRSAMAKLDPIQREAVELSFFDDLSHSEIAQRLGKPLGTVKTNIRQGLIRLRQSMRME